MSEHPTHDIGVKTGEYIDHNGKIKGCCLTIRNSFSA